KASGSRRVVILSGGYASNSQAQSAASAYKQGLRAAGWTETTYDVDTIVYGSQPQWSGATIDQLEGQLMGAAGVLLVAGDQSQLAAPLADNTFRNLVGYAVQNSPVVMTDRAMTAAMGDWYAASPEPTDLNVEDMAIA